LCQRDNAAFNSEVRKVLARTVGEAMSANVVRALVRACLRVRGGASVIGAQRRASLL
jgi:hypothetical protein